MLFASLKMTYTVYGRYGRPAAQDDWVAVDSLEGQRRLALRKVADAAFDQKYILIDGNYVRR